MRYRGDNLSGDRSSKQSSIRLRQRGKVPHQPYQLVEVGVNDSQSAALCVSLFDQADLRALLVAAWVAFTAELLMA